MNHFHHEKEQELRTRLEEARRELSAETLLSQKKFHPFPQYEEREAWEQLPADCREFFLARGEEYRKYTWPAVPASVYLEYARNGNRTHYEEIIFRGRRLPLQYLTMAECCEGKGRFLDDILDGVWAALDEASWVIPAHNSQTGEVKPLPDTEHPENQYVDLFSAECGAVLAWVWYLLGEKLGEEAPQVPARMLGELDRRLFTPFLQHRDYPWMGYHGKPVNNWNPWIISNLMTAASLACPDEEKRAAIFAKGLECLQFFVKGYAFDGGCDEGPSYWGAAGASLFDCLEILRDVTGGRADLCSLEQVRNICSYFYKMQISGTYFANYADCESKVKPDAALLYRMGLLSGEDKLKQAGIAAFSVQRTETALWEMDGCGGRIYRKMKDFLSISHLAEEVPAGYPLVRDVWFPGIQVMAVREQEGSDRGLYFSAKGGHNQESHNHNDVGSFLLYCDGKPVIVDIGTGVYEKKTFSSRRYEILQMQSQYHNLPIVGGTGEHDGREFAADLVQYEADERTVRFSLELRKAYPQEAGIREWRRSFLFDRERAELFLTDDFRLEKARPVEFVLMTPRIPEQDGADWIIRADEETAVRVSCTEEMQTETEIFPTEQDDRLRASWGKCLYRTVFRMAEPAESGQVQFHFRKE